MIREKVNISVNISTFLLLLGCVLGGYFFGYRSGSDGVVCHIEYISQNELINLERQRVEQEYQGKSDLFFGKTQEAIKLINDFASKRSTRTNKVLLTAGSIYGNDVVSISREVHSRIIELLNSKSNKESKQNNND